MDSLLHARMSQDPAAGSYYNGHYVPTSAEKTAYQSTHEPWASSVEYGHCELYFFAVTIFIAILFNIHFRILQRRSLAVGSTSQSLTLQDKFYALFRLLAYPRIPTSVNRFISPWYTAGNQGQTLLLAAGFLFTTLYCFADTYYYRPPFYGASPLGLRSEWPAMAMLPFLIVFGHKINFIGTLIGSSHEKMQVLHQGVAGLHLYMPLVHTISMTIRSIRERGINYSFHNNCAYWTGFVALAPLIWLCCASLPIFRKAGYECFWILHLAAVGVYFGFLWLHCWKYLDRGYYMYATFAVFAWGVVLRVGYMIYVNLHIHVARVHVTPSGMLHLSIPTKLRWSPGQHVFIRFLSVRPLESHPFSISSIPSGNDQPNDMTFIIVPMKGFTSSLKDYCKQAGGRRDLFVLLDGPFGHSTPELRAFDKALLIAGGSGIAYILPIFQDLVRCRKGEVDAKTRCSKIELVWAVRSRDQFQKMEQYISDTIKGLDDDGVSVSFFVTGIGAGPEEMESKSGSDDVLASDTKKSFSEELPVLWNTGRPKLLDIIREKSQTWEGRVAVTTCGSESMISDVSNAVAGVQIDILRQGTTCKEMYLQTDAYDW
ncbi:ferric reductase NAD binding domain-containing protein [Desarmillaria tabescens]|uniref:ferric-chelate reductase (NADPH) n=1 Tax=Armillaria tabescens TaxID=1929756 RepID=A0AA39KET6_ARMTA|nr:ferric reductase NAD binding domain-containing protein [Desarmillaria tabescens]XP_060335309.1 ferric reductase NAD binding domain-containing protein [Desarmillaria tabescens]KAK0459861.1 ferric reductase NAD binding domain-containing protein [Desarmillaria tabescens]KAK0463999.1 ferric reductase NAD binding domain-containing protein [Desarmillaria tabescens]